MGNRVPYSEYVPSACVLGGMDKYSWSFGRSEIGLGGRKGQGSIACRESLFSLDDDDNNDSNDNDNDNYNNV